MRMLVGTASPSRADGDRAVVVDVEAILESDAAADDGWRPTD
jgi:hypothetical protein